MKNRFVGVIRVTFTDGHVETCVIKEKLAKGKGHFLNLVKEYGQTVLKQAPEGKVKLNYRGDFAREMAEYMGKTKK